MEKDSNKYNCLNCGNSEMEAPLVSVRYAGENIWICSPCMPVLIHNPAKMIGALQNADKIPPSPHSH
jgi:ribosomal protein L37AE/L43A